MASANDRAADLAHIIRDLQSTGISSLNGIAKVLTERRVPRPAHVVVYDCADCQTSLGTASRVVVATVLGKFRLTRGEPKSYVETARAANSRADVCGVCGSPIYSAPPGPQPKVVALGVGTLLQCAELIPSHQFWCRSSVRWLPQLGSVDGFATQPVSDVSGGFVPE